MDLGLSIRLSIIESPETGDWDYVRFQILRAKKTRGRRPISDKIGKTQKKSGLKIGRGSGLTPVARGGSGAKAPQLVTRPVPRNVPGQRLVGLTNGC